MTKEEFKKLEYKIADNFIFCHKNKIKIPIELQKSIFRCFKISEIDSYKIFKKQILKLTNPTIK